MLNANLVMFFIYAHFFLSNTNNGRNNEVIEISKLIEESKT